MSRNTNLLPNTFRGASGAQELQSNRLSGAFRAFVEYNCDPEQRGRVKIRLYQLHGPPENDPDKRIKTDDLPWALPCFPLAGGQDYGSFVVPPVGSTVIVIPLSGQSDQYIYIGGYYSTNLEGDEYLRAMGQPKHEISMAGSSGVWKGEKGPEVPLDALEMLHASPEVYVTSKSVKGAALVTDDKDERESTALIDRAGQGLFFEAEVQKGPNQNNGKQRKAKNVTRGKSVISPSDTVANETRVILTDAAGQSVLLHAHKGSERIKIVSRPFDPAAVNYAGGKDEMAVELDSGSRRIVISSSSSADSTTRIVVDAAANYVEISGSTTIRLLSDSVEISGRLVVRGDMVVDGDSVVTGDSIVAGRLTGGDLP